MTIAARKLELRGWIGISRTRHGKWAKAFKEHKSLKLRADLYHSWEAAVRKCHDLTIIIQRAQAAQYKPASSASIDVARSIAVWEGGASGDGRFRPYQDEVGVWTIGYGHTNSDGAPYVGPNTGSLTRAEATTLLLHDLNVQYVPAVRNALGRYGWKVDQKKFDALVSFCYNLGPGYFGPSHDIGQAMQVHNPLLLANRMLGYNHAGGAVLAGLTRRRQWERQLFLGGTYAVNN